VFEYRVLWRIYETKRQEVARGWRRLHSEELHKLYTSPYIIRAMNSRMVRWVGHVVRMGKMRNIYKILVGKT
jgi:hypothetical protein